MQTVNLVLVALKNKAPELHKSLESKGKLNEYTQELASQISSAVSQRAREIAQAQGYSKLMQTDPMKAVGVMNTALALAREEVHAQMLEFPQDETSPPKPGATTPSDQTT